MPPRQKQGPKVPKRAIQSSSDTAPAIAPVSSMALPAKRRGRPPKCVAIPIDHQPTSSGLQVPETPLLQVAVEAPVPKKRGRPPKSSTTSEIDHPVTKKQLTNMDISPMETDAMPIVNPSSASWLTEKQKEAVAKLALLDAAEEAEYHTQQNTNRLRLSSNRQVGNDMVASVVQTWESDQEKEDFPLVMGINENKEYTGKVKCAKGDLRAIVATQTAIVRESEPSVRDNGIHQTNRVLGNLNGQKTKKKEEPVIGGLDDSDIEDTRPSFDLNTNDCESDVSEEVDLNEVVEPIQSKGGRFNNFVTSVNGPRTVVGGRRSQQSTNKKAGTSKKLKQPGHVDVAKAIAAGNHTTSKGKCHDSKVASSRMATGKSDTNLASVGSSKNTNIIIFNAPLPNTTAPNSTKWKLNFIPSITYSLFVSKEPFRNMRRDSEDFKVIVSQAWESVFPLSPLNNNDDIIQAAYDRINTKRSLIAKHVLEQVVQHFQQRDYHGNQDLVKKHASWALKPDGFAWHAQPTPIEYAGKPKGTPGYQAPTGVFQSQFIVNTARKFIKHTEGSQFPGVISATNPPIGLYAIILASLYRAFTVFFTNSHFNYQSSDDRKNLPVFSQDNYCKRVQSFVNQISMLSDRRWANILETVNIVEKEGDDDDIHIDLADLSAACDNIYVPESPMKKGQRE